MYLLDIFDRKREQKIERQKKIVIDTRQRQKKIVIYRRQRKKGIEERNDIGQTDKKIRYK